jgi:predicted MFS family arabinose efflux permease
MAERSRLTGVDGSGKPTGPPGDVTIPGDATLPGDATDPSPESGAALRSRRGLGRAYWGLWRSVTLSSFGDGLVLVAFPLLALTVTRRPLAVAAVAVAARAPVVFFGLVAGAMADRVDRRRLAVTAEAVRLVVLIGFIALEVGGAVDLAVIYVAVFLLGTCEQFFDAATMACLPQMVAGPDLDRANGFMQVSDLTAEGVAGQSLGGALSAVTGALPFVADAISFAGSALLLRRSLPPLVAEARPPSTLRSDVVIGLRFFAGHRSLRLLAGLIGSFVLCQSLVLAVITLYARQDLHLGPAGYGVLLAVPGVSSILGGLFSDRIIARLGLVPSILGAGLLAGGSYLLLGGQRSVVLAGVALALEGAGVILGNVASMSLRQRLIPAALLGRVGMTFRVIIFTGMPLGALVGGLLAASFSLSRAIEVAGAAQLVALTVFIPQLWAGTRTGRAGVVDITSMET